MTPAAFPLLLLLMPLLCLLLQAAGIEIPADAAWTIFAPNNEAFSDDDIQEDTGLTAQQLLQPENRQALTQVITTSSCKLEVLLVRQVMQAAASSLHYCCCAWFVHGLLTQKLVSATLQPENKQAGQAARQTLAVALQHAVPGWQSTVKWSVQCSTRKVCIRPAASGTS
jgi:hypothetical protein